MDSIGLWALADGAPINSGDVATWVTGVATILLFLATLALFFVGYRQLQAQVQAQEKRDLAEAQNALREQAEHISCWVAGISRTAAGAEHESLWIAVLNQSAQPVYQVVVSLYAVRFGMPHKRDYHYTKKRGNFIHWTADDPAFQVCVAVVPPGIGYVALRPVGGMSREAGIEIAFQDTAGRAWVRTPFGDLGHLGEVTPDWSAPTASFYGIDLPTHSVILESELPPNVRGV